MNKKIFKSIFFTGIAAAVVSVFIIMWGMYSYTTKEALSRLRTEAYIVADGVASKSADESSDSNSSSDGAASDEAGDAEAAISYLSNLYYDNYRVTWISADGKVLFDSDADASRMENHLEREEVAEAFESGYGESVRYSETIAHTELYAAVRVDAALGAGQNIDAALSFRNTVIRVSCAQRGIFPLLGDFAQPLCILVAVVVMISLILAKRLAAKIADPINKIDPDRPEDYIGKDDYAEVSPLLLKMSSQQEQLAKDRAEIEESARIRQEFTANVSHELKSPLHLISGYAEIIENGMAKAEDIKPFAGKIRKESTRLSELVEDIIALTELDSLEPEAQEETNLTVLVENIADSLEPAAAELGVKVNIDASGDYFVEGDPKHLHSIVYNLLDNAIKYNREGGVVFVDIRKTEVDSSGREEDEAASAGCGEDEAISSGRGKDEAVSAGREEDEAAFAGREEDEAASAGRGEDEAASARGPGFESGEKNHESASEGGRKSSVILQITDTGIGIPKEHLNRVFERFYREDKSRSKNIGGTGLGLSIVKHAAILCGAEIQIDSEVGKGTKVAVIFNASTRPII